MKKFTFLIPLVLLAACAAPASQNPDVPPDTAAVIDMVPDAFVPEHVTVKKGASVCWINNDEDGRWPASNVHPTHEVYSDFDPKKPMRPGETWCFTFDKAGTWIFHDHLLPELTGSVLVTE